MGSWNHIEIIQKIHEKGTWNAHQGTTQNRHIGYCLHTLESTNVKVQILSWEVLVTVHVPCTVTTEHVQHYVP